jgi:hypothetical protein
MTKSLTWVALMTLFLCLSLTQAGSSASRPGPTVDEQPLLGGWT